MIKMYDVLRIVQERRGDAVVFPTMTAEVPEGLPAVSIDDPLDLPIAEPMGKASSLALGVCLARPDKRVIVFDGDGSLLMNLGSLVTVAGKAPRNLYHFVFDNGVYAITGGQPVPNVGRFSFAELAKAAGYSAAYEFDDLEELATSIDEIMGLDGPVLLSIKTDFPDTGTPPDKIDETRRRPTDSQIARGGMRALKS